jgi:hypothetical protein
MNIVLNALVRLSALIIEGIPIKKNGNRTPINGKTPVIDKMAISNDSKHNMKYTVK